MEHPLPASALQFFKAQSHVGTPTLVAEVEPTVRRAAPNLLWYGVDQCAGFFLMLRCRPSNAFLALSEFFYVRGIFLHSSQHSLNLALVALRVQKFVRRDVLRILAYTATIYNGGVDVKNVQHCFRLKKFSIVMADT